MVDTFKEADAEIQRERKKIGDKIYLLGVTEHVYKKLKALPKYWIFYSDDARIMIGDRFVRIFFSIPMPMPGACSVEQLLRIEEDSELAKEYYGWEKKRDRLNSKKKELRKILISQLWAVNTLKQLKEAWPLGEKYFPKEEKKKHELVCLNDEIDFQIRQNKQHGIK